MRSSAYLGPGAAAPGAGLAPGSGLVAFCRCFRMASGLLKVACRANVTMLWASVLETRLTSGNQHSERSSGLGLPQEYWSAPACCSAEMKSATEVRLLLCPLKRTWLPAWSTLVSHTKSGRAFEISS